MRRNMGRAYEGRALWIFCKKLLQSKPPVVSAIAAMPAFPSTPGVSYGEKWNIRNTGEGNMPKKSFKKNDHNINKMFTWHCYAIDGYVSLFQQIAENALHLCGGDVFSPPAERVPTTVTEVHVAQLIHHQHVP